MDKLTYLEERVLALEERSHAVDIFLLEAEYARAWDFGTGEDWAMVFTDDGIFELAGYAGVDPIPAVPGQRFVGRAALEARAGSARLNTKRPEISGLAAV